MTIHTLKNKQDKVALSGYNCVILAIGRVPNTDTLGLGELVSHFSTKFTTEVPFTSTLFHSFVFDNREKTEVLKMFPFRPYVCVSLIFAQLHTIENDPQF